jgi:hypothetical protein
MNVPDVPLLLIRRGRSCSRHAAINPAAGEQSLFSPTEYAAAVELRQPSLDDVFLTLTGRRTDDEQTDQEVAA